LHKSEMCPIFNEYEECRQRITRCNAQTCNNCCQRHTECLFKTETRQQKRQPNWIHVSISYHILCHQLNFDGIAFLGSRLDRRDKDVSQPKNNPPIDQTTSWSYILRLHHGPSCGLPSIQHIYRKFSSRIFYIPIFCVGTSEATAKMTTGHLSPLSVWNWPLRDFAPCGLALKLITYSTASQFLDLYFGTYHHLAPFLSRAEHECQLNLWYCDLGGVCYQGPKDIMLKLVLAIGAR
jgi:hypothetical protein